MITGELKCKANDIWNTMWSGGISNSLSVIEQLTYLLSNKRLDEPQTLKIILGRLAKLEPEIVEGRKQLESILG